ncbi:NmrA family NAD(P)-binding protein [Sinosporangium siamense]|uniref:Nucleotide-diphosphate-sugar epimerase n=1 Tax=Sinosporangium siamense TaxID=1367973 RepID=A0A919V9Z4_9ACTN|nr:NAD(P)H-binding protein [Sinosporangium siamense]GII95881.1 nucleotide-diphosphate-sugar epimerase [Sinosporangium siamense]
MYVIAGATGRVGSATAKSLLAAGAKVRVLTRRHTDAERWAALGVEARVVSLDDRVMLGGALEGCAGFFTLLPFDLNVDDLDAHADRLIGSIAGAVADQRVPHVVMLSSGGADLAEGTGPIAGLHRLEQALLGAGTTLTALRSGHFQEKVADVIDIARSSGVYPVFAASADIPHSMVATVDIGAVAAQALQSPPASSESVDIIGPAYSERAVAAVLGDALGRELQVTTLPEDAWSGALVGAGFRPYVAESLAELYRADEGGLLAPRGDRSVRVDTGIETTIRRILAS